MLRRDVSTEAGERALGYTVAGGQPDQAAAGLFAWVVGSLWRSSVGEGRLSNPGGLLRIKATADARRP